MTGESARVVAFGSFRDGRLVGLAKERDDDAGLSEPLVPESALAEAEKARKKAVQQLTETNRQLQTGLSISGRQFYGTKEDIEWLRSESVKRQGKGVPNSQLTTLLSGLEALAGEIELMAGNNNADAHKRWARTIRTLASAGLEGNGNG